MLTALWNFLNIFWTAIWNVITWIFNQVLLVFVWVFATLIDGFFTIVLSLVNALDLGSVLSNINANWSLVDPRIIYLINQLGISSALSLILYATGIRMLLNLIPSTITRV